MLVNFLGFQLGWFACVLGSAYHLPWLGVMVALAVLCLHYYLSVHKKQEAYLIIQAMLLGLGFDAVPMYFGWVSYFSVEFWPNYLPPLWMIMLWGLFASTLNSSLSWLKNNYKLAGLLGAVAGPLSYWAGTRMDAFSVLNWPFALGYLLLGWALVTPLLLRLASQVERRIIQ